MKDWQDMISETQIQWLLQKENLGVRYFTLRDLLDRGENNSEVLRAKAAIPSSKLVDKILSQMKPEGYWESSENPYLPKYKSTFWQIMTLGQLGLSKDNSRVRSACEFVLNLQLAEGGFSSYTRQSALERYEWMQTRTALKEKRQLDPKPWAESLVREHQYSCLTGNVCAALLRIGYQGDPRVKKALEWLVRVQNSDGGWLCPYWKAHLRDTHGCFYGTICPLEAFSEVPEYERSNGIKGAIEKGSEFLLMHRLYKADHHGLKVINRQWLKFSFPCFYGYDVLRGLSVLTRLGYIDDERLTDAVGLLLQKRTHDGRWRLESAPTGRMQANIETVGKPSKWITLNALKVLKRLSKTQNERVKEVLAKT